MESAVDCTTLNGATKRVAKADLILRPAAYAIILHGAQLLLLRMQATGKYHLPGGGIELGETIESTLRREVAEETGLDIEVGDFAHFEEFFFYYDPSEKAYHGLFFYYICRPLTLELLDDDKVTDESAEAPRWIELASLQPGDFQSHGEAILSLCKIP